MQADVNMTIEIIKKANIINSLIGYDINID